MNLSPGKILEKVLKFVSEKGNEAWQQVSFTKVTTFKAPYACKVVQVDFF